MRISAEAFNAEEKFETTERIIESTVDENASGQRLDIWLSRRFTYLSRNQWQDAVREHRILLNGKHTRCSRILQTGELITFRPERDEPPATMDYRIVYEDEFLYVVDKGGDLPCHPAGPFFRHTLWFDMKRRFGQVYIANRLDRETSGLMLVGKTPATATRLAELFQSDAVCKRYHALVYGKFTAPVNACGYLLDIPAGPVRKKRRFVFTEETDGEKAETLLTPLEIHSSWSRVEAVPRTGRLHQIRATLCSLGFPLLGDKLYGPDETIYLRFADGTMTDGDRERLVLPRQALHALSLEFTHPHTGQALNFTAPWPDDLIIAGNEPSMVV